MEKKTKGNRKEFFREFLKNGKGVGSVYPSSRFLQRKMVSKVDFHNADCIVEFGPGEGCITRQILKRMGPDTQLFSFEMNEMFIEKFLQFDDPRVHIIHDSAENFGKYLAEQGLEKADYIISSLPLTNFPIPLKEKILDEAIEGLAPGGIYMQYQYSTTALKMLKQKFSKVKMGFIPINIPPAFVYTCYA